MNDYREWLKAIFYVLPVSAFLVLIDVITDRFKKTEPELEEPPK